MFKKIIVTIIALALNISFLALASIAGTAKTANSQQDDTVKAKQLSQSQLQVGDPTDAQEVSEELSNRYQQQDDKNAEESVASSEKNKSLRITGVADGETTKDSSDNEKQDSDTRDESLSEGNQTQSDTTKSLKDRKIIRGGSQLINN